jgi:hypothetical protein
MRAEEFLPDDVNQRDVNGVFIRKGSIGAFLANARILADPKSSSEERAKAEQDIIDALPALRATGLFDVLEIKDKNLRAFVEAHSK